MVQTAEDAFAEVITRMADDPIDPDETEDLIVALRRSNIIDGPTMMDLLGLYLDEKQKNVRSIPRL